MSCVKPGEQGAIQYSTSASNHTISVVVKVKNPVVLLLVAVMPSEPNLICGKSLCVFITTHWWLTLLQRESVLGQITFKKTKNDYYVDVMSKYTNTYPLLIIQ